MSSFMIHCRYLTGHPNPTIATSSKGKEEEKASSSSHERLSIDDLPNEVLSIIFHNAIGKERDQPFHILCSIRSVCLRWRDLVDAQIIEKHWNKLTQTIRNPILQTFLANRLALETIRSTWLYTDPSDLPESYFSSERTYFSRFADLTSQLKKNGAPIANKYAILGFEASLYDAHQNEIDKAIGILWRYAYFLPASSTGENPFQSAQWTPPLENVFQDTSCQLVDQGLRVLPKEIGLFSSLKTLNLHYNRLTTLPNTIKNLTSLQSLTVYDNQFNKMPQAIGGLTSLVELNFHNNRIKTIPTTFGNLRSLTWLSLSTNHLKTLPETIGKLTQLISFSLNNNQIESLPDSIGNLALLEALHLNRNRLTTLPKTIGKLTSLKTLDLDDNYLTTIPQTIGNLTRLEWLFLQGNRITTLPKTLWDLSQLDHLCLNDNPLFFILNDKMKHRSSINSATLKSNYFMCINYVCKTPVANLCRAIHLNTDNDTLEDLCETLPEKQKHEILVKLAPLYHSDQGGEMKDLPPSPPAALLAQALIATVKKKVKNLSDDQWKLVHWHLWDLADRPTAEPHWGMLHTEENIIRFIDAIELATQPPLDPPSLPTPPSSSCILS